MTLTAILKHFKFNKQQINALQDWAKNGKESLSYLVDGKIDPNDKYGGIEQSMDEIISACEEALK